MMGANSDEKTRRLISAKEMGKALRAAFLLKLEPLGFNGSALIWTRKRCPIAYDWIRVQLLTYGNEATFFRADVHVGIHSEPIERMWCELEVCEYKQNAISPTFQRILGYVMPEKKYVAWTLSREEVSSHSTQEMVEASIKYGLPFIENYTDWDSLYQGVSLYGGGGIRLPIAKYLAGRYDDSINLMKAKLKSIERLGDPASMRYRECAKKLTELCEKEIARNAEFIGKNN